MEISGEDPFDSIIPLCRVSSSQEEQLRRYPFARQRHASTPSSPAESEGGEIRIASTPILMVSMPESDEEDLTVAGNSREDEFVTPPEEAAVSSSGEFRPAVDNFGYDSGGESVGTVMAAVDLSRDSELGFSAIEAVQSGNPSSEGNRLESEVLVVMEVNSDLNQLNLDVEVPRKENLDSNQLDFGGEMAQRVNLDSEENRCSLDIELTQREKLDSSVPKVLTRELSLKAGLGESPLKKSKLSQQNSEESNKAMENGFDFNEKPEIHINNSKSPTKRKLELGDEQISAENILSLNRPTEEFIAAETILSLNKPTKEQAKSSTEVFIAATNVEEESVEVRRLPNSIIGQSEDDAEESGIDKGVCHETTIFDVLNLLAGDHKDETPNISFLEICKARGLIFPRPAWWPGHGEDDMEIESFGR